MWGMVKKPPEFWWSNPSPTFSTASLGSAMDDVPNLEKVEPEQPQFPWRITIRAVLLIYLITLPACTQDAGHFGPGFFPLLAALFLVPVFTVVASMDAAFAWSQVSLARAQLLIAVGMSIVALGYWAIIAFVIAEKSGA
jgi:hypothetical protein